MNSIARNKFNSNSNFSESTDSTLSNSTSTSQEGLSDLDTEAFPEAQKRIVYMNLRPKGSNKFSKQSKILPSKISELPMSVATQLKREPREPDPSAQRTLLARSTSVPDSLEGDELYKQKLDNYEWEWLLRNPIDQDETPISQEETPLSQVEAISHEAPPNIEYDADLSTSTALEEESPSNENPPSVEHDDDPSSSTALEEESKEPPMAEVFDPNKPAPSPEFIMVSRREKKGPITKLVDFYFPDKAGLVSASLLKRTLRVFQKTRISVIG